MKKILITLFDLEFLLLILFKKTSALAEIFLQSLVLKGQIVNLTLQVVEGLNGLFIATEQCNLLLERVIFFVKEVDLVCKFAYSLLINFMSVFDGEHLQILSAFVESLESLDFFLPHDDCFFIDL